MDVHLCILIPRSSCVQIGWWNFACTPHWLEVPKWWCVSTPQLLEIPIMKCTHAPKWLKVPVYTSGWRILCTPWKFEVPMYTPVIGRLFCVSIYLCSMQLNSKLALTIKNVRHSFGNRKISTTIKNQFHCQIMKYAPEFHQSLVSRKFQFMYIIQS